MGVAGPSHDLAAALLIQTGILESGVGDALFPTADAVHPVAIRLRQASLAAGHALWHTWHGRAQPARQWLDSLSRRLADIDSGWLPAIVETSTPEGYAYYGLFPEMYLEAAKACHAVLGPVNVVCLGIRNIGSSLSAVVAAALEELGSRVESYTLRPRGPPFSRCPRLDRELTARFLTAPDPHFLLVDEGPGLSGSSLGGTADLLHQLGVPDDHIHLFPSWSTDGSTLRSGVARDHWRRHRQFTASFEDTWLCSGRLSQSFPGTLRDVSAGKWRSEILPVGTPPPAVHPQHERRKYLLSSTAGPSDRRKLLRFAGLDPGADGRVERIRRLADAGFTAHPEHVAHGFVLQRFVPGSPVQAGDADPLLLERVASYLAHLYLEHRMPWTGDSKLPELVEVNVSEVLRDSAADTMARRLPKDVWLQQPVSLDGRMLAHEWIRTDQGWTKVDAMDHHDDHFYPGCEDIAWDVAAAGIELDLSRQERRFLVDQYRRRSGDRIIAGRLHPYAVAYLAFRLGYTSLAAMGLGTSDDGRRFTREHQRYRRLLERELAEGPRGTWDD